MTDSEILAAVQWETRKSSLTWAELYPVLNRLQEIVIQPKAQVPLVPAPTLSILAGQATYSLTDVSASIWLVTQLTETKDGREIPHPDLLPEYAVGVPGIRRWGDTLIVYPTPTEARTINFYAWRKLVPFGATATGFVPSIPVEFHDLYVLAMAYRFGRRNDELDTPEPSDYGREFAGRLQDLVQYQTLRKQQPARRRVATKRRWS